MKKISWFGQGIIYLLIFGILGALSLGLSFSCVEINTPRSILYALGGSAALWGVGVITGMLAEDAWEEK